MIPRSLLWHQYFRVAIFLLVIAGVYIAAAVFAWRRARGRRASNKRILALEYAAYVAALAGSLCILYAYTVEPYWPEITHVSLSSPKLHAPLRIVHISDLHCDGTVRLEKRLPELIRQQHPDLIAFTGDTFVKEEAVPQAKELLAQLAAIAPTYVVLGNWDSEWARVWRQNVAHPAFFEGTNVHNLVGHGESLAMRGDNIWITGAASNQQRLVPGLLQEVPKNEFSIFLFHFPDEVELVAPSRVDLYLAGHTHGGQIALPFYGALMTLSKYDKKYESGLHRIGSAWLYVNRGIGLEGHPPRARFFARPEITVIDVAPQSTLP